MPRVNLVKKARADQGRCGACREPLPAGSAYRWWSFRYGGRHVRCMKLTCRPRPSDLTQSAFWSAIYGAREILEDAHNRDPQAVIEYLSPDAHLTTITQGVIDALSEAYDLVVDAAQDRAESASAIEEHFPGSDKATELEEDAYTAEQWSDQIEEAKEVVESAWEEQFVDRDPDQTVAEWLQDRLDEALQEYPF